MRKVFGYVCVILGITGGLLLVGSIVAFVLGPEEFSALWERARPILPFFLAWLGLVVLVIVLANVLWPELGKPANAVNSGTGTVRGGGPVGEIRCGKCEALNGGRAKFCDQCGAGLGGDQPAPGNRDVHDTGNPSAPASVWDQVRGWLGW
jgi:hypothetical protein